MVVQLSIGAQPWFEQHVILLEDGSHLCTCLMLINKGIICRHFIKILTKSTAAFFNISLIPSRWYNDQVTQFTDDEIHASPLIQLCNVQRNSVQTSFKTEFSYLSDIRGGNIFTSELKEVVSKRQQYTTAHGLQKTLQKPDIFKRHQNYVFKFILKTSIRCRFDIYSISI